MPRNLTGTRIRTHREAIGLKQRDLARRAGISASYLNLIEHNRRVIAGKVLINIASALAVEVSTLQEGADSDLVRQMQSAAAAPFGVDAELDRIQDMISRFPGWAALVAAQQRRLAQLEHKLDGLSDRLSHDPFLAETLHEILSSVTAIHATSGILTHAPDMEGLQQRRFQTNIHDESTRLSDLTRGLASYFDQVAEPEHSLATPLDELGAFLERHRFHFPVLENGQAQGISTLLAGEAGLASGAARDMAVQVLTQYARDAEMLPLADFMQKGRVCGFETAALARQFHAPLEAVYRRLAFLPKGDGVPDIGLISCDGTGAVLLRKPLAGFPLPRYGAACALWPLYQAMTRPYVPLAVALQTAEARVFHAEALAIYADPAAVIPVLRSTMILRAGMEPAAGDVTEVGQSCRICPRVGCFARREPSIHGMSD